jgi:predicted P-loop ATPase
MAVAFDRGNLYPVAMAVRAMWPDAWLVFAADNDEKEAGIITNKSNPGVWSAQQAAVKLGDRASVVWPDDIGCDWNDVASRDTNLLNKLLVKASMPESDSAPSPLHSKPSDSGDLICYDGYSVPDIYDTAYKDEKLDNKAVKLRPDGNPEWFTRFLFEKEPNKQLASMREISSYHDGKSLNNTVIFVKEEFAGLFVLNEFSDEVIVRTCPPWTEEHKFRVHRLSDNDVTMMTATLEYYGFKPSIERTRTAIEAVANIDRIHPVRHYFSNLVWDGVPRLGTWLEHYCGARNQPHEYLERIGKMWLVAGVKRVFEPGAVFHNMLVLEGKTNIGKSRTLRELATFGRDIEEEYFTDAIRFKHIDKPAALQILQGKLIVEFAELADMDGESDESLKAWITQNSDEMVKKWDKYVTKYPRQFILAGTTNVDNWLRDPTGNRRYWPVRCIEFDHAGIKRDKEQLWAEAVALYNEGYSVTMPDDDPVYRLAKAEQAMRLMEDPWGDLLNKEIYGKDFVTYQELYNTLCIPIKDRDNDTDRRIRGAMVNLGWEFKADYALAKTKNKVWVKKR